MATICLYSNKINGMPDFVNNAKKSVGNLKDELAMLKNKCQAIDSNYCNADDIINDISTSTKTQEEKIESLEKLNENIEQFAMDTERIDNEVADIIEARKNDFYDEYTYLKPESEKPEESWWKSTLKSVGEWCKEHLTIITVIAVIAIAAIAVVFCSVSLVAVAAIAGIVALVACLADTICMIATGGKSISDICHENGLWWLGDIFNGISIGCDIVSIVFPAGAAIKTMAKVGIKSFVKGSIQAAKFAFKETIEKVFKSGFKNGIKNFTNIIFKTFIFDIDDFSRVNSNGKRVFNIIDNTPDIDIIKNTVINNKGFNADGTYYFPTKADGYTDGVDGVISNETLQPGMIIDRYGHFYGEYTSPSGIPYENRALDPGKKNAAYNLFEVIKPVDVQSGRIASWFNEPGGGIQYKFNDKIINCLNEGILKIIDYPQITLKSLIHFGEREFLENTAENI